ncbi:hypothetical protein BH11PLA2_BH11PLA2_17170 [soil metagenome]
MTNLEESDQTRNILRQVTRTIMPHDPELTTPQRVFTVKVPADRPDPVIEGFLLQEQIGHGGMGVVYRARDLSLERDVAVKLLQDCYADNIPYRARFLEEAKITGQLQHPGIPAVYQVGMVAGGSPFLAMKLIKGRSLTELIVDQVTLNVLAVFEQIAQAVGYAHAHDVIHRDLKPSNIMVGAFGEVQVMDWGLAKIVGSTNPSTSILDTLPDHTEIRIERDSNFVTQAGSALGTPAFMPPEQAVGDLEQLSPRSDVFGLGGILCMMLTGQPPFLGRDAKSTRILAAQGKTTDAFTRLDNTGAEAGLIALCKRCLATDPAQRFACGAEVAASVAALRTAAEERAKQAEVERGRVEVQASEQSKRRHVVNLAGGTVMAVSLAGALLAGWQYYEKSKEQQKTLTALQLVEEQEAKTQTALAQVTAEQAKTQNALAQVTAEQGRLLSNRKNTVLALNTMTDDVVRNLFAAQQRLEESQKTFLRKIILLYDNATAETSDDISSRALRAQGRLKVASIQQRLGELADAEDNYLESIKILKEVLQHDVRDPRMQSDLAHSHTCLGHLYSDTGRRELAEKEYLAALDIRLELRKRFPQSSKYASELAGGHNNLGIHYRATGRPDLADQEYRRSIELRKELADKEPEEPHHRADLARSHNNLGTLLRTTRRRDQAEVEFRTARDIRKALVVQYPDDLNFLVELAYSHNNLATLLSDTDRKVLAEVEFVAVRDIRKSLVKQYPAVLQHKNDLSSIHNNLGTLYRDTGRVDLAEAEYKAGSELRRGLITAFPTMPQYKCDLGNILNNWALLRIDQKKFAECRELLKESEGLFRAALKAEPRNPTFRNFFCNNRILLMNCLLDEGEYAAIPTLVAELQEMTVSPHEDYYDAAKFLTRSAELARKDPAIAEARREPLAVEYTQQAMESLKQAIAKGYRNANRLEKDKDLNPLRDREDFKMLLADLKATEKPKS